MMPKVSILIVNYNAGDKLAACLRSLRRDPHADYEIIVVDNASTDGSADRLVDDFSEVRWIRSDVNLGFAGGNNLAARHAHGEYLAFLNPDTVVTPGWLEALLRGLKAHPSAGLATSKILLLNQPDRINTCGNDMHYTGLTLCRGMGMEARAFSRPEEVSAVSGAAFVMYKALFGALGGFDESFFLYMEDTDLSLRARLAGFRCLFVPSSVVYHDYSLRFGPRKTFYQERNRYLMLLKSLRWSTLLALLPALLLSEVVTWGFILLREPRRVGNKLSAYAWVAQHWREVMRSRGQTQRTRAMADHDLLLRCTYHLAFEQTGRGLVTQVARLLFDPLYCVYQLLLSVRMS